jgi:hypothetical protein
LLEVIWPHTLSSNLRIKSIYAFYSIVVAERSSQASEHNFIFTICHRYLKPDGARHSKIAHCPSSKMFSTYKPFLE